MKIDARLEALKKKHDNIQVMISDLEVHHLHYEDELHDLKRKRLVIKDKIQELLIKMDEIA